METIKTEFSIIGTPIKLQNNNCVFINRHYRQQLGIEYQGTAMLCITQDSILVCRRDAEIQKDCYETTKAVNVFAGRVGLPSLWLQRNGLQKEDFVFQLLTTNGVLIFPHQQQIKL